MFDLLEKTGEPLTNWLSTRLRRGKKMPLENLVDLHAQKIQLETEMLKIWTDPKTGRRIDAFICPVAPHPVPPIDRWNAVSYTSSFVLLDYPAGTIPVRDFKEADLHDEWSASQAQPLGPWDKVNKGLCEWISPPQSLLSAIWSRCTNMIIGDTKSIDRKVYLNTPLSVQVVAPKLQERRLYQAMKVIDDVLRGKGGNLPARL